MSVFRVREVRRGRPSKLTKMIDELYRQGKCRECSVVVTRMDFAKILGKFTKVKIQYESGAREEKRVEKKITSPNTNARLRSNENGMVLIHRSAYKAHPAKEALGVAGRPAARKLSSPVEEVVKRPRGRPPKNKNLNLMKPPLRTQYRIIFYSRRSSDCEEGTAEATIVDLLPCLSADILPTDEWLVDYQPQLGEPKKDLVYDRIAAELEDLMNDSKPEKTEVKDDFPSIMDLLNDALEEPQHKEVEKVPDTTTEVAAGSGDVEAILRGDPAETAAGVPSSKGEEIKDDSKEPETADTLEETNLKEGNEKEPIAEVSEAELKNTTEEKKDGTMEADISTTAESKNELITDASTSPSQSLDADSTKASTEVTAVLSNSEKMDIDDVLSKETEVTVGKTDKISTDKSETTPMETDGPVEAESTDNQLSRSSEIETSPKVNGKSKPLLADQNINVESINYIIFKRVKNEECNRLVKCSKNLNYSIEIDGRPVELVGAPKYLSSVDDLRLMLQIVHESDLDSFNVVHAG